MNTMPYSAMSPKTPSYGKNRLIDVLSKKTMKEKQDVSVSGSAGTKPFPTKPFSATPFTAKP